MLDAEQFEFCPPYDENGEELDGEAFKQAEAKYGADLPRIQKLKSEAYWRGLEAAQGKRNVWLDLCDWQALGAVDEQNLPQLLRVLRVFLDVMGSDRVVWGSDLPQTGVGSAARARTRRFAEIALELPEWGERYGIAFTEEERDGLCHGAARAAFSNIDFDAAG